MGLYNILFVEVSAMWQRRFRLQPSLEDCLLFEGNGDVLSLINRTI
ncbi:hypothetical protein NTG1052_940015 [Candidatus Nitrotoga sp. 1052]|nr:hypothetical protein NTG1052_940015 [Candidatus Nitrotoga sp. 1052]